MFTNKLNHISLAKSNKKISSKCYLRYIENAGAKIKCTSVKKIQQNN
jgi:hypothetical protein